MLFDHIIAQTEAKRALRRMLQGGRAPHALLLHGPTGAGSLALGLAYAQGLLCPTPGPEGDPCGHCKVCHQCGKLIHPDLHFVFPTVGANAKSADFMTEWRQALTEQPLLSLSQWLSVLGAENKQGNITREECNAVIRTLSLKAFEGRAKVLLLWLPEFLGREGNRLLKLIEEPPEQTYFVLVCEQLELVLPTILSRCQIVKAPLLSDDEVAQALVGQAGLERERADHIAFMAGGDMNRAFALSALEANDEAAQLLDWLRKCWKGYGPDLVQWADSFAALGKERQKQFFHYGLHFLREALLARSAPDMPLRLHESEKNTATNLNKVLNLEKIAEIARFFDQNLYHLERNAHPKILFLNTSINIHQLLKG